MDKNTLISKFADCQSTVTLAHILDICQRCLDRNILTASDFLTEPECVQTEKMLKYAGIDNFMLFGGYPDAERRMAVFLPDYLTEENILSEPSIADIKYFVISPDKFYDEASLSHRDCLGAIMNLGINREKLGDIVISEGKITAVVKSSVAEYLAEKLKCVGKYTVHAFVSDLESINRVDDCEILTDTVSSLRLDAVCSAIFNLSRSRAAEEISSGKVFVNGLQESKADRCLSFGDKISLRGKGKAVLQAEQGRSSKGKIRFTYKRYK